MWLVDQLDQKRPLAINRWGRFKWVDLVLFSDLKKSSNVKMNALENLYLPHLKIRSQPLHVIFILVSLKIKISGGPCELQIK